MCNSDSGSEIAIEIQFRGFSWCAELYSISEKGIDQNQNLIGIDFFRNCTSLQ